MRAQTKNTHRILSTIGLLVLAVTIGYGQGMLAEGAMKLLKINQTAVDVNTPDFVFVNHTEEKDSFSFRDLFAETFQNRTEREAANEIEAVRISRTIIASAVKINYESDVETEQWMTTPLSNNMEAGNVVENWMTESFTGSVEADVNTENWMTESFTGSIEEDVAIEDWMTESFTGSVEPDLNVENWMTESFTGSLESNLTVENWMTESFTGSLENELEVEDWMTEVLYTK